MPEPIERTRQTALAVLLDGRRDALPAITEERVKSLLSERLVRSAFNAAWQHQFDDDRAQFKSTLKALIDEAIAELKLAEPTP